MANESVLHIIENSFLWDARKSSLLKNKSSLKNEKLVLDSVSEMLKIGSTKEVKAPTKVINPLFVSENSAGKKRFILDLRYINEHL